MSQQFNDDDYYVIEGFVLNRIAAIASRMNTDSAWGPFEMRDLAQEIQAKLDRVEGPFDSSELFDELDVEIGLDDDEPGSEYECEYCGGSLNPLGRLGCLDHYRCRDCGAPMSVRVMEEDEA